MTATPTERLGDLVHSVPVPVLATASGAAVIAAAILAWRATRSLRGKKAADTLTVVAAAMASSVAATGMWHFFTRTMHLPVWIQAVLFAFMEIAVLASALRARAAVAREGHAGADGLAVWVLTCASGFMSATEATSPQEALVRLGAPLVAAWLWERSMVPERRARRAAEGKDADGVFAKIKQSAQQRFLAALGVTAADQTALEIQQNNAFDDAVELADRLASINGWLLAGKRRRRVNRKLRAAVRVSGAAHDRVRTDRLIQEIAAVRHASDLATLDTPSPWMARVADTATPRHGGTPTDTRHATAPCATATAGDTTPDTVAPADTTRGNDTTDDTDTPARATVPPAATPKPTVATRPRPARVVSNLPMQNLDADVAQLTETVSAWPEMSKADAIRNADQLLPGRAASQIVKALGVVGVKVDDVLVRKTRSRDRQNAASATGGDDTTDKERVA